MTKILVLGSGYIGSEIISSFHQDYEITVVDHGKNFEVISQKCPNVNFIKSDILDFESFKNFIDNRIIFYCIDNGGVVESIKNPNKYEEINVTNFSKLVQFLTNYNCKLILFSTSYVYSDGTTKAVESNSLKPTTLYGELRKKQEKILINSGINYVILRLSNIYGYATFQKIGNLGAIEQFLINAISGKPISIYGSGNQKIDYLHISDLMELLQLLLKSNSNNLIFNVGSGKALELFEVVNLIIKIIGPKYNIIIKTIPSMNVPNSPIMSIQKITEFLNWTPKIDINLGIFSLLNMLNTKA